MVSWMRSIHNIRLDRNLNFLQFRWSNVIYQREKLSKWSSYLSFSEKE